MGFQEDAVGRSPRENTDDLGPLGTEGPDLLREDLGPPREDPVLQEEDQGLQDKGKDQDLPCDLQEGQDQDH